MHTCIRTHNENIQPYTHIIHTCMHAYIHACIHTNIYIHAYMHAYMHTPSARKPTSYRTKSSAQQASSNRLRTSKRAAVSSDGSSLQYKRNTVNARTYNKLCTKVPSLQVSNASQNTCTQHTMNERLNTNEIRGSTYDNTTSHIRRNSIYGGRNRVSSIDCIPVAPSLRAMLHDVYESLHLRQSTNGGCESGTVNHGARATIGRRRSRVYFLHIITTRVHNRRESPSKCMVSAVVDNDTIAYHGEGRISHNRTGSA
jgi:hypothetical protein